MNMNTVITLAMALGLGLAFPACGDNDKSTLDADADDVITDHVSDVADVSDPAADPLVEPTPDAVDAVDDPPVDADDDSDVLDDGEDALDDADDITGEDEWSYPGLDSFDLATDTDGDTVPDDAPLLITEIMANPSAVDDNAGEYVEVLNVSGVDIDINGLYVRDAAGGSVFTVSSPTLLVAGGYVLFGRTTDAGENYGVSSGATPSFLYMQASFNLNNTGTDYAEIGHASSVIHHVDYGAGGTGSTLVSIPGGAVESQSFLLDNDYLDGTTSTATWCLTPDTTPYGYNTVSTDTDYGTPGLVNPSCS
ncbi:MAG: lamin tail domain-containing protein [Deltaproteobacteria bacterium]|nr:lamin tail domain-containing protein [Deltaproteobacteria bacterium]